MEKIAQDRSTKRGQEGTKRAREDAAVDARPYITESINIGTRQPSPTKQRTPLRRFGAQLSVGHKVEMERH